MLAGSLNLKPSSLGVTIICALVSVSVHLGRSVGLIRATLGKQTVCVKVVVYHGYDPLRSPIRKCVHFFHSSSSPRADLPVAVALYCAAWVRFYRLASLDHYAYFCSIRLFGSPYPTPWLAGRTSSRCWTKARSVILSSRSARRELNPLPWVLFFFVLLTGSCANRYGLYIISSVLHAEPWHLFTSFWQFVPSPPRFGFGR